MSDKPQTTRNRIQGIVTRPEGQIIFIDTPGIHKPKHQLGEVMMRVTENTLAEVDLVFWMVNVTEDFGQGEEFILELLQKTKPRVFLLLNKIDLIQKEQLLTKILFYKDKYPFLEIVPISALNGEQVDTLPNIIFPYLPEGPAYYPEDQFTDTPEKFIVGEIIREKVLQLTREEIPHSIAVVVERFETRRDKDVIDLYAAIIVERDSQKGILIGKKGSMLKEIGTKSRIELEHLFGSKMYVELFVKVEKDWRNRSFYLREFGFHSNE
jgi:GTP-binding protein Era